MTTSEPRALATGRVFQYVCKYSSGHAHYLSIDPAPQGAGSVSH